MVGDTVTDMTMGRNSGVGLTIGVLGGAGATEDICIDADCLVSSVGKIPKILASLQSKLPLS